MGQKTICLARRIWCFSYSRSHIEYVYKYILNQEAHHNKTTFKEEYLDFLKKYEVGYEEKYLFEWIS